MRRISLSAQVILFTTVRIVLVVAYRMVYPFLAVFARGLGMDVAVISSSLALRSATGVLGVFMAPVADRFGRRLSMLIGLALFSLSALLVVVSPTWYAFIGSLILTNFGMQIFIPAMQAYLADRIPYAQLGRALGITEISWSLAFILGVPAVGWLIARGGWTAPFPALAVVGAIGFVLLLIFIPSDRPEHHVHAPLMSSLGTVFSSPVARAALAFGLLTTVANEVINLMFGVWMEDSFGLKIAALGATAAVLGFSELGGSSLTALLVDRLGKERAITIGLALNSVSALLLPLLGRTLPGAMVGLFLFYMTFEFTLVSTLPLMSEVVPKARATMMALVISFFAGGRALGDLVAPRVYEIGFWANVLLAIALNVVSLVILRQVKPAETVEVEEGVEEVG